MFGIVRKVKREVRDRTVYMEIYGSNKVAYRVTAGKICFFGDSAYTYGVEAEDRTTGEIESIPDFSRDVEDAVDFTETLITGKVPPKGLYSKALDYLRISI